MKFALKVAKQYFEMMSEMVSEMVPEMVSDWNDSLNFFLLYHKIKVQDQNDFTRWLVFWHILCITMHLEFVAIFICNNFGHWDC